MIHVEEIAIRIPGLSADDGRTVGEKIAKHVADRIPIDTDPRRIEEMNITFSASPGMTNDEIASNVASQILQQLTRI